MVALSVLLAILSAPITATARVESMVEIDETDDGSITWRTNAAPGEAWVGVEVAGEVYALEAGEVYSPERIAALVVVRSGTLASY